MKTGAGTPRDLPAAIVRIAADGLGAHERADDFGLTALVRARAFAERLLAGQRLDTGEDALEHADGVAGILHAIGAAPSMRAAAWPAIYPGRALRNDFFERWHGHEDRLTEQQKEVDAHYSATAPDDLGQRVVWAGESVDLVHDIPSAHELIDRIVDEAASVLRKGAALVRA